MAILDRLYVVCKRAGVPRIHVHALRHTFGSQMAMAAANPFAIMKAMGRADIKTTMIYVSLGKSHIREYVEKLNAIRLLPSLTKFKTLPPRESSLDPLEGGLVRKSEVQSAL
jgi:integrase